MTDYDDTNRGALFKNTKKESDRHPDYRGSVNAGGKDYWLSAWLKTSQRGTTYMSLALTEKESVHEEGVAKAREAVGGQDSSGFNEEDGDDIPF